jgi:hypothetical protein
MTMADAPPPPLQIEATPMEASRDLSTLYRVPGERKVTSDKAGLRYVLTDNSGPRAADRMAQGDGSSVHIHAGQIQVHDPERECFITPLIPSQTNIKLTGR